MERVSVDKIALRGDMRAVRRAIAGDVEDRQRRSAVIWANVLDAVGVDRVPLEVMMFESLATEPDTSAWQQDAAVRGWGVRLPEVAGEALRVMPGDVDPGILDVVLVPGLAFTADGRRLGQGGGHYDRFLARLSPRCVTIGICFHEQLVDDLPIEPHDVLVRLVVTDRP
jgi:5-formyltetrahydrofolate cyclo-ligase